MTSWTVVEDALAVAWALAVVEGSSFVGASCLPSVDVVTPSVGVVKPSDPSVVVQAASYQDEAAA